MTTLVEMFAEQVGWRVGRCNVVVEGTTDVTLLHHAARLHLQATGVDVFGDGFAVVASGRADDGGVEGVNRRLTAARQNADVDRDATGALRYRFVGLFDNDFAGRKAIDLACSIDRRIRRYRDVFLLHPKMPIADYHFDPAVEQRTISRNSEFSELDWEIEDYLPEDFKATFEAYHPQAVTKCVKKGGRSHRDLTRDGKRAYHVFVQQRATHRDVHELIRLICALRSYLGMQHNHIVLSA